MRLLWPLIVEQILAVTMGIADTIMVSSVGEYALSAVSVVDNINNLLIIASVALATGGTVVVSQYIGRLDSGTANRAACQLMYISAGTALVVMFGILFTRGPVLRLIYGDLHEDVMSGALVYFFLTTLSFPFLAIYNSAAAIYRAAANSRVPMLVALLVNVMNIGGNAVFIYIFHLDVAGAGLSTLLCRVAAAVILTAMLMSGNKPGHTSEHTSENTSKNTSENETGNMRGNTYRKKQVISLAGLFHIKLEPFLIRSILSVGIPSGLESSIFQFGRLLVTRIFTAFGTAAIAANAITFVINSICFMPGMAYCMALLTIVGQCIGAGNYQDARRYTIKILKLCYASLTTLSLIIFIFMEPIVGRFHLSPEAHDMAKAFLTVHCVTLALFWPLSFAIPNALRAAGDTRYCMIVAIVSMWSVRVSAAFLLAYPLGMGPLGVWIAMGGDFILRSLCYTLRWRGRRWETKRVIRD
jgi:Na+-driven multidrug efflux pump